MHTHVHAGRAHASTSHTFRKRLKACIMHPVVTTRLGRADFSCVQAERMLLAQSVTMPTTLVFTPASSSAPATLLAMNSPVHLQPIKHGGMPVSLPCYQPLTCSDASAKWLAELAHAPFLAGDDAANKHAGATAAQVDVNDVGAPLRPAPQVCAD